MEQTGNTGSVIHFPEFPKPTVSVVLWEERRRPDEAELRRRLANGGYESVRWASEPNQAYIPHAHIYPELLWLLAGSITIVLPATRRLLELAPGDRIELPPGLFHGVMAGPDGAGVSRADARGLIIIRLSRSTAQSRM